MYYTGVDPRTMKPVYVPENPHEKAMQRALMQYKRPENYALVKEALILAGRQDLIGYDRKCLIRPDKKDTYNSKRDNKGKSSFSSGERSRDGGRHKKKKAIRNVHKKKN